VLPALLVLWVLGAATVVRYLRTYTAQSPTRMRT
jgi:hypothetical protein